MHPDADGWHGWIRAESSPTMPVPVAPVFTHAYAAAVENP